MGFPPIRISFEKLEALEELADKDPNGLANFILIKNRNNVKGCEYHFRVVCEKVKE